MYCLIYLVNCPQSITSHIRNPFLNLISNMTTNSAFRDKFFVYFPVFPRVIIAIIQEFIQNWRIFGIQGSFKARCVVNIRSIVHENIYKVGISIISQSYSSRKLWMSKKLKAQDNLF